MVSALSCGGESWLWAAGVGAEGWVLHSASIGPVGLFPRLLNRMGSGSASAINHVQLENLSFFCGKTSDLDVAKV